MKKLIIKILKLLGMHRPVKIAIYWFLTKQKSLQSYDYRVLFWKLNGKIRKSATVHTKQGVFKVFFADSVIGKSLYCSREFEMDISLNVMTFLNDQKLILRNKGTILDIGANNGVISVGMIYNHLVERAIAIEPDPKNFSLLQYNVRKNKLENSIICLPYAVSDKKGMAQFELSNTNFGDHRIRTNPPITYSPELYSESSRRVIKVETDSLDHLVENLPKTFTESIVLIWIDVQGFEGYVFNGGRHLLAKGIPVVSEIWPYGIRRVGMSQEQYCKIANEIWSSYWVIRDSNFIQYSISELYTVFDELGFDGNFYNILYTK